MLHYLQLVTSSLAATVETAIMTAAMRLRLMGGARAGCRPSCIAGPLVVVTLFHVRLPYVHPFLASERLPS